MTTSSFWAERLAGEARRKGARRWIAEIPPVAIGDRSPASLAALCCEAIADFARQGRCDVVILDLGWACARCVGDERAVDSRSDRRGDRPVPDRIPGPSSPCDA